MYDQLSRIGKIELPEFNYILGSVQTMQYRNKLEFGCSNKRWLTQEDIDSKKTFDNMNAIGFHITGAFDKDISYHPMSTHGRSTKPNKKPTSMSMLSSKTFLLRSKKPTRTIKKHYG